VPYFIWDESPTCSGWAVVKADGEQLSCHSNKQEAIEAMVGLSAIEGIEPGGSYEPEDEVELELAEVREVCEDCDGNCEVCKEVREVNLTRQPTCAQQPDRDCATTKKARLEMDWLKQLFARLAQWRQETSPLTSGFGLPLGLLVTLLIWIRPPLDLIPLIILVLA
jgi:hypothetical protein